MLNSVKSRENTFVTVKISDEIYGIDVRRVKEVIGLTDASWIPDALPYMKGVISLRGRAIPLVDMRIRFGLPEKEYDRHTVVIITNINKRFIGLIVDTVLDVVIIDADLIQNTPHFSAKVDDDCIGGITQPEGRTIIILNVNRLFTGVEIPAV